MKTGDLLFIGRNRHSYPKDWIHGTPPHTWPNGTPAIYLSQFQEQGSSPRTFYNILTPAGEHHIFSNYCTTNQP